MSGDELNREQQALLLRVARDAIGDQLRSGRVPKADTDDPVLLEPRGAFVTLHLAGALRGCIGTFVSQQPLIHTVQEMAISAATRDPRFPPLQPAELDEIDIEISALSPLRPVSDPNEVEVGRHGIFIKRDFYSGVLLPQVATEQGWDRETFLQHTCLKAGLPPAAWRDPKTTIEVFEAQVFGEQELAEDLGLEHQIGRAHV